MKRPLPTGRGRSAKKYFDLQKTSPAGCIYWVRNLNGIENEGKPTLD
jgi:hypothetical protein